MDVQGGAIGVIATDVSNVEANRTGQELVDLPVAIYSRSTGSTSPISTLTTQPGVQTDGNTLSYCGHHLGPYCRHAGRDQHHEH